MNTLIIAQSSDSLLLSIVNAFKEVSFPIVSLKASAPGVEYLIDAANSTSSRNPAALLIEFDNVEFSNKMIGSLAESLKIKKIFGQNIDNFSTVIFVSKSSEDLIPEGIETKDKNLQMINANKIESVDVHGFSVFDENKDITFKNTISLTMSPIMQRIDDKKIKPHFNLKNEFTATEKLKAIEFQGRLLESYGYRPYILAEGSEYKIMEGRVMFEIDIEKLAIKNIGAKPSRNPFDNSFNAAYYNELERLQTIRYQPINDDQRKLIIDSIGNSRAEFKIHELIKRRDALSVDMGL